MSEAQNSRSNGEGLSTEIRAAQASSAPVIVGIGASAGGLEALEQFFAHVPPHSGLAYVVVQHLAPQHASMLTELLGRRTDMPVEEAKHGRSPRANHVYVIAPGTVLGISGGSFHVRPIEPERHAQIDAFLRTLAEDLGERAIGILLSGAGDDGTAGLRAIKDHGGMTLVQTLETAKYDAMPRSAIEAGVVDDILPVEEMPGKVLAYAARFAEGQTPARASATAGAESESVPSDQELGSSLSTIFEGLRQSTGHDFSQYKRGTVLRRLRRRIQMRGAPSLRGYLELLAQDPKELELLAKDLLIGVTQFFRDPEVFEFLGLHVLPRIISANREGDGLRIWVPGCASGEEAYSIAILVQERLAELSRAPPVQIFATDIDTDAIAEARQGRYPADIARHVSPARLERFFIPDGSTYTVVKEVREMCIFSEHSLIRDPPFSGLDLISCRNLLIYLDADLQRKLVPVFHYALRPGGYLFLGPSESLASHPELFAAADKRFRIFKRVASLTRPAVDFPFTSQASHRSLAPVPHMAAPRPCEEQEVSVAFERLVLQEYGPPGAVVNDRGDIICVVGLTGKYLQPAVGVLSTNIFDIAHANLRIELRTALHAAARTASRVVRDNVQVEVNGSVRQLRVIVRPMPGLKHEGLFAILLLERSGDAEADSDEAESVALRDERGSTIEQLESELRTTRASLRATIEELESANEELKSSNEELLSTNEEMQSTNEELQSSQEELKSVNEELTTVNAELGRKVDEVGRANSDLQNLFSSTETATLFLDREQRITRFTPAARELFRLIDADVGRPLSDLAPRFEGVSLTADADAVLRTLGPLERQVETVDRRAWYLLRILPYRTLEQVIEGTVVTLADITQIKHAESERERLLGELRAAHQQLGADLDATIRLLNVGSLYLREANLAPVLKEIVEAAVVLSGADFGAIQLLDETSGTLATFAQQGLPEEWLEFWAGKGPADAVLEHRERLIIEDVEKSPLFAGSPALEIHLRAGVRALQSTPLVGRGSAIIGVLSTYFRSPGRPSEHALKQFDLLARLASDVLERARTEEALAQSEERFRALVEASSEVLFWMSPDWSEMRQFHSRGFLGDSESPNRNWLQDYVPAHEQPRMLATIEEAIRSKKMFELEHEVVRKDGSLGWVQSRAIPLREKNGEMREWFGSANDVTTRKQAERVLAEANQVLREADRRKNEFLGMLSHELRNPLAPIKSSLHILDRVTPGGEQALRAQAIIDRQVKHLTRLVDDLLDITRVTSGKIQLQCELLDLNELVRRAVEDHRDGFLENGVELEMRAAPNEVWVNGDMTRLSQAIGNLLQNAVKFTPRGGQTTLSVAVDETQRQAIVCVKDSGRGIAPEMMPRMFEAFTQVEVGLDRASGGLGLGLAVSKGLVEMHGGSICGESDGIGKGSTFTITLPLESAPLQMLPSGEAPGQKTRRVLIIEDNTDAAGALKTALELSGHKVEVAYNGPDGMTQARAFKPEIVFCDIGLPQMDGYEVARAMRKDPELGNLTLVALTGYAGPDDVTQAKAAGFDIHVAKPATIESLETLLAELHRKEAPG